MKKIKIASTINTKGEVLKTHMVYEHHTHSHTMIVDHMTDEVVKKLPESIKEFKIEIEKEIPNATDKQKEDALKAKILLNKIKISDDKDLEDVTTFKLTKKGKLSTKRDQYKENNWSKLKKKI